MSTPLPAKQVAKKIRECLRTKLFNVYVQWPPYSPIRVFAVRLHRKELQVRCAPGQALMWAPVASQIVNIITYIGHKKENWYVLE